MDELNNSKADNEIDLLHYVKLIFKNKRVVFLFFLIGLIFGLVSIFLSDQAYRGEIIIKGATIDGKPLETSSETSEKIKAGSFGKFSNLSASLLPGTNMVVLSFVSEDKEEISKVLEDVASKIISEQNDIVNNIIQTQDDIRKEKVRKLKNIISYFIGINQQVSGLQLELISLDLENNTSGLKTAEKVGQINISSIKNTNPLLVIIISCFLGILVALILISIKEWWSKNKKLL